VATTTVPIASAWVPVPELEPPPATGVPSHLRRPQQPDPKTGFWSRRSWPRFLRIPSERWLVASGVFLLFAIGAVALFGTTSPVSSSELPGSGIGDPPQGVWFLAWMRYALEHWVNPFRTFRIDYPTGVNLADNTLTPFLGVLAFPVTAFLGPISAFNLLLRLAMVLSAITMWCFLRTCCGTRRAAFVGAALYGFSPYIASELQGDVHLDLAFVPLFPLILWAIVALLRGTRRPWWTGAALGVCSGLEALISPELLVECGIVLALGGIASLIVDPRRAYSATRRIAGPGVVALVILGVFAGYPIWYAVRGPDHLVGPVQATQYLQTYSADLLGPVVPSAHQLLAPTRFANIASHFSGGNCTENLAYLSIPILLLTLVVAVRARRHLAVIGPILLALAAFVLSLGNRLTINGRVTTIPMPEALLPHLGPLDSIVPARFGLVVILFLSMGLAIGVDRSWKPRAERAGRRPQVVDGAWLVLLVCCAVVLVPARVSSGPPPDASTVAGLLGSIPENSVVLTYPLPKAPYSTPMLWQAEDGLRTILIGGYATVNGPNGVGVASAPLLSPPSVQEFLAEAQDGGALFYPPVQTGRNLAADLCAFVVQYHVTAVIDADLGTTEDTKVNAYFTPALGQPVISVNGVSLYRPNGACPV
jgi:hypothetical protein